MIEIRSAITESSNFHPSARAANGHHHTTTSRTSRVGREMTGLHSLRNILASPKIRPAMGVSRSFHQTPRVRKIPHAMNTPEQADHNEIDE
jgi:hypothetical protein